MRKLFVSMLAMCLTVVALAQTAPANFTMAANKFRQYYNAGKPDSIFNMFSSQMKAALPLDKFSSTTTQLKAQLGDLKVLSW